MQRNGGVQIGIVVQNLYTRNTSDEAKNSKEWEGNAHVTKL